MKKRARTRKDELLIHWGDEWRTVLTFAPEQRFEVQDAAAMLSRAAGGLRLRILDSTKRKALDLSQHGTFLPSKTYVL